MRYIENKYKMADIHPTRQNNHVNVTGLNTPIK